MSGTGKENIFEGLNEGPKCLHRAIQLCKEQNHVVKQEETEDYAQLLQLRRMAHTHHARQPNFIDSIRSQNGYSRVGICRK